MKKIEEILARRNELAETVSKGRLNADLRELQGQAPDADQSFEPERRHSDHEYDKCFRIRFLEAFLEQSCAESYALDRDPPILLESDDEVEYRRADRDGLRDHEWFIDKVQGRRDRHGQQ